MLIFLIFSFVKGTSIGCGDSSSDHCAGSDPAAGGGGGGNTAPSGGGRSGCCLGATGPGLGPNGGGGESCRWSSDTPSRNTGSVVLETCGTRTCAPCAPAAVKLPPFTFFLRVL